MSGADFPESVKRALRPGRAAKLNRFATIVDHVRANKGVPTDRSALRLKRRTFR